MPYGIFEATNIKGRNLSFVSTVDIENGQLFHRGELVTGSKDIYNAVLPTAESLATTPVFVAGDPAWNYANNSVTDKNEDAYIIPKGKSFRAYPLGNSKNVPDKYTIANYQIDLSGVDGKAEVGQYVAGMVFADGKSHVASADAPADVAYVGKIISLLDVGYEYYVGQNVDTRVQKVLIEVVKNDA